MKKITITIVMAMLCLNFWVNAQEKLGTITPLKVGDKLPKSFWQQKHTIFQNGQNTRQTLAQHKRKLIILDFWATWCSACISHFDFLDSLSRSNKGKLEIIQVNSISGTGDTESKILSFFKDRPLSTPCIYQDTILKAMFPHTLIPHYVWINRRGQVEAITGSLLVTAENIKNLTSDPDEITKRQKNRD
jgi:thiol-disulfide isomerase/thioredoxin